MGHRWGIDGALIGKSYDEVGFEMGVGKECRLLRSLMRTNGVARSDCSPAGNRRSKWLLSFRTAHDSGPGGVGGTKVAE